MSQKNLNESDSSLESHIFKKYKKIYLFMYVYIFYIIVKLTE